MENYNNTIELNTTVDSVFSALTEKIPLWWTDSKLSNRLAGIVDALPLKCDIRILERKSLEGKFPLMAIGNQAKQKGFKKFQKRPPGMIPRSFYFRF